MNTIYGIGYDFHRKNGLYLMLNEKQGEELSGSELIPLHIRMMESNQIPHLLPLSIEELDFKVRLYYNITSKRDLTTYLKNHTLTSFEFYQLFIHIITTLEQSKLYMLNEHQYVLQEDFIYVGKEPQELFLTYLPINSIDKEKSTLDELKSLMMRVVEKVEGLQGSEQKHIAHYVEDPAFSLSGLKELLTDLQKLRPAPFGYQAPPNQDPMFQGYDSNQGAQGEYPPKSHSEHQQPNQSNQTTTGQQSVVKKKSKKKKTLLDGLALTQRQKVYIVVLGLLSLTIIWKTFEAIPNKAMLITSSILSVIIVVAVLIFVLYRPKEQEITESETVATSEQSMNPSYAGGYGQYGNANNQQNGHQYSNGYPSYQTESQPIQPIQPRQSIPQNIQMETNTVPAQQTQVQQHIEEIKQPEPVVEQQPAFSLDTNLLVENDDTVLLDDDGDVDQITEANTDAYLEIDREGELERITLSDSHFTIGRNETAVDYLEDSVGVSRIHLEFIKIDNQYGVKDLGSRNGTKLNGESLVPYKIYALNEEDIISFGKVDYRFKWE